MNPAPRHRRPLIFGLAITLASLAVGLVLLTAVFMRQSTTVEETAQLQKDSVSFITFQFEREFLRYRHALDQAINGQQPPDWTQLQLRFEILLSRAKLLADNPTIQDISGETEYTQTLPQVQALLQRLEPLMETPSAHVPALRLLVDDLHTLGPNIQSMSHAADRQIKQQLEDKVNLLRLQNRWIVWLVVMLVIVLLLVSASLWMRHLRLNNERLALELLNQELLDATETAERANRAKSHFLANMSHELRTPFNGMMGMMQLLEDSELNAEQREQLLTARSSAQHLLNILNDILDMSALDAGKLTIKPEPVDMRALVQDVFQLFKAQGELKRVQVEMVFVEEAPALVWVDPTRVRQILFNLLNNALKFTQRGSVHLRVSCLCRSNDAQWTLVVQDSGVGIAADKIGALFQRFQQADETATRRFGGTGLGLNISKQLAHMMGGDITVSSEQGVGSTFTVTVLTPMVTSSSTALNTQPSNVNKPPPSESLTAHSPALDVLVAEDHPINQKFVSMLLQKLGHRVTLASNGLEALEHVQSHVFDLVLMDVHMPEMDGIESTRRIRQLPAPHGKVPIIALSADVINEAKDRALEAGMTAFVSKPVQKAELEAAMRSCLPA
jgi:two-component system, sensor histidine kinase